MLCFYLQPVAVDSWIQLDASRQTLYGLAVAPFWNGAAVSDYIVRAEDSDGNSASADLSVSISTANLLTVSHAFQMRIITDYTLFTSRLSHTLWWLGNVTAYSGEGKSSVTVDSITDGSVIVSWSNNTINSIQPPYRCPGPEIYSQYRRISGGGLVASLPQYEIGSMELRLTGICSEYTTRTTTQSTTVTTTPSTTTPTTTTPTTTTSTTTTSK